MAGSQSLIRAWAGALLLLSLAVLASLALPGPVGRAVATILAFCNAAIIAGCFMRLRLDDPLLWLLAIAAVAWIPVLLLVAAVEMAAT